MHVLINNKCNRINTQQSTNVTITNNIALFRRLCCCQCASGYNDYDDGYKKGIKPIWILLKQETVSGSGKSATCQHPTTQLFTGRLPFLPPNQHQSTEGKFANSFICKILPKMHRNTFLAAELQPDPLGELMHSAIPHSRNGGYF